ncbi:MAG: hypothetical protein K2K45_00840 [Muribaculaceae bacterium]|nr:hypothetical protein [Muribaculaceae bacterium]
MLHYCSLEPLPSQHVKIPDWFIAIISENDYRSWVKELKQRYLSARLKASIDANRTLLGYYWSLGRDIADKQYANTYGSGFYKTLSHDLRSEMPEEKGFSESNIRYMYRFISFILNYLRIFHRVWKILLRQIFYRV